MGGHSNYWKPGTRLHKLLEHGRRIWKARQIADFRHWEFHVFFDQKANSPKRVFFLHWKVEGCFFNFWQIEKWEFWKFNKGFFLCFDHFLVCWRFYDFFDGRWASQNLWKSLAFPGFPRRTITPFQKNTPPSRIKNPLSPHFPDPTDFFCACNTHSSLSETVN